jgi:hypothetical protein
MAKCIKEIIATLVFAIVTLYANDSSDIFRRNAILAEEERITENKTILIMCKYNSLSR